MLVTYRFFVYILSNRNRTTDPDYALTHFNYCSDHHIGESKYTQYSKMILMEVKSPHTFDWQMGYGSIVENGNWLPVEE